MRRLGMPVLIAIAAALLPHFASAAPAAGQAEQASAGRQTLVHDGIERHYLLRVPADLRPDKGRVPLVLVLHGGGGNADNAETMTGFTAKASKEGFIVAYPEGSGRLKGRLLTWNAVHCCGYAMEKQVDDVGFINALIDKLTQSYPIDTGRIYATGMSNGGMMTHRLGIALSGRLAAIVPVVATVFGDEPQPAGPLSALMINGALDQNVPNAGGAPGGRGASAWDGMPARPMLDQARFWAAADACASPPQQIDQATTTQWRYTCPGGKAVELYLVKDNGHAWPGGQPGSRRGDTPSQSLNATDLIWAFFQAHPK
ncbi:MAG: hypothetical protein JWQ90_1288 [Hydrocarboniphaga sp.]|nr:hypothetical protein [Hydrocarboniphaga sp.]